MLVLLYFGIEALCGTIGFSHHNLVFLFVLAIIIGGSFGCEYLDRKNDQ